MAKTKTKKIGKAKSERQPGCAWFRLINKISIAGIIVCSVGFLICTNDIAIKGFVLADLKSELADLEKEHAELELTALRYESMEHVDSRARELNMVKVDSIDYITVTDSGVAMK